MNGRRIWINVGVFAGLAVIMTVWALRNVVTFDFVERPYTVSAEFDSSPGLHPDFEVAYLGIRIGKIKSIRLDTARHKVIAELAIDRGVEIPEQVKAAAGRKSAVGEPYVDLSPLPGADPSRHLKAGTVITQTSVPVGYGDLFGKLVNSLKAIDPESTKTLVHELALGWEGREGSLQQIIDGADALTATFADKTDLVDALTKDVAKLTGVLAEHRGQIGSTIDNSAALLVPLAELRGRLDETLKRTPGFTSRFLNLFNATDATSDCAIDALAASVGTIAGRERRADLAATLQQADELIAALDDVLKPSSQGNVLNLAFVIKTKTKAPLEYKRPKAQPKTAPIPTCADTGTNPFQGGQNSAAKEVRPGAQEEDAGKVRNTPAPVQTVAVNNAQESGSGGPPAWLIYLPPVLALLVLLRVALRSLPGVIWPRRRR
ncbi:MCE family protein [Actinocorallia lasiicapitis]